MTATFGVIEPAGHWTLAELKVRVCEGFDRDPDFWEAVQAVVVWKKEVGETRTYQEVMELLGPDIKARPYRTLVKHYLLAPGSSEEEHVHDSELLQEVRRQDASIRSNAEDCDEFRCYVVQFGLFLFGEIESAEGLITSYRSARQSDPLARDILLAVRDLLPLPRGWDIFTSRDQPEILRWLSANRSRLRWDEEKGQYMWA